MITKKNLDKQIYNISIGYATDMIEMFSDPVNRGSKFNWNTISKSIASLAGHCAPVHITDWDKLSKQQQDYIEQEVYRITLELSESLIKSNRR